MKLLRKSGYIFHTSAEFEIVKSVKEKCCIIQPKPQTNISESQQYDSKANVVYLLPDGSELKLGDEQSAAGEILFSPEIAGFEFNGVHEILMKSIMKCDIDLRKDLFGNIYLSGGSTLFPGFPQRIFEEISHKKIEKTTKVFDN